MKLHYYKFKKNRYLGMSTYKIKSWRIWSVCFWSFEIGIKVDTPLFRSPICEDVMSDLDMEMEEF